MRQRKLSRRVGTIALVGGIVMAILVIRAAPAPARSIRVFIGVRFGAPVVVPRLFSAHPPVVRIPFVLVAVKPFAVRRTILVTTTVFSSRPVVFVPPARVVFHREFVRPTFVPVVALPAAVERGTVMSSPPAVSSTRAGVIGPPAPAAIDGQGSVLPAMGGAPGREGQ